LLRIISRFLRTEDLSIGHVHTSPLHPHLELPNYDYPHTFELPNYNYPHTSNTLRTHTYTKMAPEPELDWAEEIDKWGYGIELAEASAKDIETYIRVKIYENEKYNKMDKDLWDLFQEDFKDFTLATLSSIRTQYVQNLRSHLRSRGVYVAPNTKRTTIGQTLFDVIAEEEQHKWTDDEIQEVCTLMGTIKSMNLRYQIP
jgi:hypothetical protein